MWQFTSLAPSSFHCRASSVDAASHARAIRFQESKCRASVRCVANPQAFKLVLNYGLHFECRPEALRDRTSLQFGLQGDAEPPFIPECALVSACISSMVFHSVTDQYRTAFQQLENSKVTNEQRVLEVKIERTFQQLTEISQERVKGNWVRLG